MPSTMQYLILGAPSHLLPTVAAQNGREVATSYAQSAAPLIKISPVYETKMRLLIFAILGAVSTCVSAGDLACIVSSCISVPGGKMTAKNVQRVMDACDKFTYKNAGSYAIKMSVSEINERYERYGINDPIVQANSHFDEIMKSPLEFNRDWEKLNYQQIVYACNELRRAYYNPNGWR